MGGSKMKPVDVRNQLSAKDAETARKEKEAKDIVDNEKRSRLVAEFIAKRGFLGQRTSGSTRPAITTKNTNFDRTIQNGSGVGNRSVRLMGEALKQALEQGTITPYGKKNAKRSGRMF